MKKVPMRKCLVTNISYPKNELFRVVKTPNNEVILDISGKINGRGAYISRNLEAIETAKKKKILDRALETTIDDEIYQRMINYLNMK